MPKCTRQRETREEDCLKKKYPMAVQEAQGMGLDVANIPPENLQKMQRFAENRLARTISRCR
ncbi:MAG: hypothetical protein RLZZ342_299 [Candidatus Parcubacteria bacterium]